MNLEERIRNLIHARAEAELRDDKYSVEVIDRRLRELGTEAETPVRRAEKRPAATRCEDR